MNSNPQRSPLSQHRQSALRDWLRQPPCRDLQTVIYSRILELKLSGAESMSAFIVSGEDSDRVSAMECFKEAVVLEAFLDLLEEVLSGKRKGTDEPSPLYGVTVTS